jgi:hypothetical protein
MTVAIGNLERSDLELIRLLLEKWLVDSHHVSMTVFSSQSSFWHKTAQSMLFAKREELDFVASIDTMIYDNVLSCDSMRFDFDLGRDLWLTKSRFTILQRDYLDLRELNLFLIGVSLLVWVRLNGV